MQRTIEYLGLPCRRSGVYLDDPDAMMRQKRICEYLGLPCRHPKTFLDLPASIRQQVYRETGALGVVY